MQHSLVSNNLQLFCTLLSKQCQNVLSQLLVMGAVQKNPQEIRLFWYEGRKESNHSLKGRGRIDYQLTLIQSQDVLFTYSKQKEGPGHMALSGLQFRQMLQQQKCLFGDMILLKEKTVWMQVIHWQNYLFFHLPLCENKNLLIIRQIYTSNKLQCDNPARFLQRFIKRSRDVFKPMLQHLLGQQRGIVVLKAFEKEMEGLAAHAQILRQLQGRQGQLKLQIKQAQINTSLVFFYNLMQSLQVQQ